MIRASLAASLVVGALGCGAPSSRTPPPPTPLTDGNACTRLCDRLRACGGAPSRCEGSCEHDRGFLRPGFTASFVGCVEKEVDVNVCTPPDDKQRAGAIALCYSATLNVFAAHDHGASARRVLSATCRRRARCAPEAKVDEGTCVAELEEHAKAAVMLLAVARDEIVGEIASCIEASACDEEDPVPRCSRPMTSTSKGAP